MVENDSGGKVVLKKDSNIEDKFHVNPFPIKKIAVDGSATRGNSHLRRIRVS